MWRLHSFKPIRQHHSVTKQRWHKPKMIFSGGFPSLPFTAKFTIPAMIFFGAASKQDRLCAGDFSFIAQGQKWCFKRPPKNKLKHWMRGFQTPGWEQTTHPRKGWEPGSHSASSDTERYFGQNSKSVIWAVSSCLPERYCSHSVCHSGCVRQVGGGFGQSEERCGETPSKNTATDNGKIEPAVSLSRISSVSAAIWIHSSQLPMKKNSFSLVRGGYFLVVCDQSDCHQEI